MEGLTGGLRQRLGESLCFGLSLYGLYWVVGIVDPQIYRITFLLIAFSVRYRRRPGVRSGRIEGSLPLELAWTVLPFGVLMFLFVWGTRVYLRAQTPPEEAMHFQVTAKQWMWKIRHPSGQSEINTLHVPVGEKVVLTMISEDVIHSFFVPAFRTKRDVLPGMYSALWFRPTKTGTYHLFCAEYCGTKHSEMKGSVVVLDQAAYQAWLDGRPGDKNPVEAGALLFQNLRCDTCHFAGSDSAGLQARGPDLAGRFGTEIALSSGQKVRFDERYVRESLFEPQKRLSAGFLPLMPSYQGQIGESDVLDLIAYLKSLAPPEKKP